MNLSSLISKAAQAKGIVDTDAAAKLIDRAAIKEDENGVYTGITEAVEALAKEKTYLVTGKPQPTLGTPTNPGGTPSSDGSFTMTQIQDPKFYQENREAIQKAQQEGKLVEDRPGAMAPAPSSA